MPETIAVLSLSHKYSWFLQQEVIGHLFLGLESWRGGIRKDICSWYISLHFYLPHVGVGPVGSVFLPLLPVSEWLFLDFLLVELWFSWISCSSAWRLFCILVRILMWSQDHGSASFTYVPFGQSQPLLILIAFGKIYFLYFLNYKYAFYYFSFFSLIFEIFYYGQRHIQLEHINREH